MTTGGRFASLVVAAEKSHTPLSVTFEITQKCNLRCVHCYNFDRELPRHPDGARGLELSPDEIHRIIDEIRAEGALFLAFTGGEPTSHARLEDFVLHASQSGLFVRLKSNGTQLTQDRARKLSDLGLQAVDISVYGATQDTHDSFAKQEGAFERTLAGIRAAREADLEVRLSFVLTNRNEHEASSMISLARGLNVQCNLDTHLTARHDCSRSSLWHRLDAEALGRLYRGPLAEFVEASPHRRIACPCARSVCGIGATGEVYPCIGAPLPAGNLRTNSFHEIWQNSATLNWVRSLRNQDFPACNACNHFSFCRRSSGVMLENTGNFTGPARFGDDLCCVEAEVIHGIAEEKVGR